MHRSLVTAVAAAALAFPGVAGASEQPLGEHVAQCAQEHLGQRADPPGFTCMHGDHSHVFATFGEMVLHMLEHDG